MHASCSRRLLLASGLLVLLAGCGAERGQIDRIHEQTLMLTGAGSVRVDVPLQAGRYRVSLEEDGVDARLTLEPPIPLRPRQAEGTLRRFGRQSLLLAQDRPGVAVVEIVGRDSVGKTGQVLLAFDRLPTTAAGRREESAVEELLGKAYEAIAARSPAQLRIAEEALLAAATRLQKARRNEERAHVLLELARLRYAELENWTGAAETAQLVMQAAAISGDDVLGARARAIRAAALMEQAQEHKQAQLHQEAELLLGEACRIFAGRSLTLDHVECVNNIGLLDDYRGRYAQASATYQRAAALFRDAGDDYGEIKANQNAATMEYRSGHLSQAIAAYEKVLPRIDARRHVDLYGAVVSNLASASALRGDFQRALELHSQALALYEELGRKSDQAKAQHGLGSTYALAGDPERALPFFDKSLSLARPLQDRGVRVTLLAMGNALADLGRNSEALEPLQESMQHASSALARAQAQLAIAHAETQVRSPQAARARLQALLADSSDPVVRARVHAALARIDVEAGRFAEALAQALPAAQVLEKFELGAAAADAYATAAQAKIEAGAPREALSLLLHAQEFQGERRRRIWSADLRASNLASHRRIQDLRLLALEGGDDWTSFWVADSFKAQSLRELRAAATASQNSAALADTELRLSDLQLRVEAQAANLGAEDPRVAVLLDEIRKLRVSLDAAPVGWRAVDSHDVASGAEQRARLDELLPDEGAILAYHLGSTHSYAWLIHHKGIERTVLPSREKIAAAANAWISEVRSPAGNVASLGCAASLARMILEPIRSLSAGARLWVVPDAELHGVPFAALSASVQGDCSARLIDKFELGYLPSVRTALVEVAPVRGDRAAASVAIVADPVFAQNAALPLPRLPATVAEARLVAASFSGLEQHVLLGAHATRERFLALPFGELAVLHLATHAQVRTATPELSTLYLSGVDADGRRMPFQITVADIRRYRAHAGLVVLSACETSLGRVLDGEGSMGLTHAFLGAGARAVVSTDWRIGDRATTELMRAFYANLAGGKDAMSALAAAQRHSKAAAPALSRDWAAFRIVDSALASTKFHASSNPVIKTITTREIVP